MTIYNIALQLTLLAIAATLVLADQPVHCNPQIVSN